MSRVDPISPENATGEVKEIFNSMGNVINIFRCMANSPATLKGFLELNKAASKTSLSPEVRELIALALAESNHCQYCLSAHTTAASMKLHLPDNDILNARKGVAKDPKTTAILEFVKKIADKRGNVTDSDVTSLKKIGVTDQELVEIILVTMVNMFTNYFNLIVDTKIDFPIPAAVK
jgi:uncharacterized peroxidase-related enzyme